MRSYLALVTVTSITSIAHADVRVRDDASPDSVARAGASMLSDDTGGALWRNPAAMAQRSSVRVETGISVRDDDASMVASERLIESQGAPTTAPHIAVAGAIGPFVLGAVYGEPGGYSFESALPPQDPTGADVNVIYPHRYSGTHHVVRNRAVGIGAAWRATDWLGIGVSGRASRISVSDGRILWGGIRGVDLVPDPNLDILVEPSGVDSFVPGGTASVIAAPIDTPLEFAIAATYLDSANLDGVATIRPAATSTTTTSTRSAKTASTLPKQWILGTGARLIGDRFMWEIDATVAALITDRRQQAWSAPTVTLTHQNGTSAQAEILGQPFTHLTYSVESSIDIEVIPEFIRIIAGYQWLSASTRADRLSPALPIRRTHTLAVGLEAIVEKATVSIGYSRTFSARVNLAVQDTQVFIPMPLSPDQQVPVEIDSTDFARDLFGVAVEFEL